MTPMVLSTCFSFVGLIALYIEIIFKCDYKISAVVGLCTFFQMYKYVEFSDSIEDCNLKIRSMIYFDSQWYMKSRNFQRMIKLIIQICQRSEHFSYGGLIIFNRPLLVTLFRAIYSFMNCLLSSH